MKIGILEDYLRTIFFKKLKFGNLEILKMVFKKIKFEILENLEMYFRNEIWNFGKLNLSNYLKMGLLKK